MAAAPITYPEFEPQVRDLVQQHRKIKVPRLRLAVYFSPSKRSKRDIHLLEVVDGIASDAADQAGELFEFAYGSTPALPLPPGTWLRMVLTNPAELKEAIRGGWKGVQQLRAARQADSAVVIYADTQGKKLWDLVK